MRDDLDRWANIWFWALVVSTLVVVLGLICEAPEVLYAVGFGRKTAHNAVAWIRALWYIRIRKIDLNGWEHLCPELVTKKSSDRNWIAIWGLLGWLLVATGVAGEGFAEYWVNDAETDIRAFDEARLTETTNQAGSAAKSAKVAHEEAEAAKSAAEEAQRSANAASASAKHVAKLEERLTAEVEDTDLLLAASESGFRFQPDLFNSLSNMKPPAFISVTAERKFRVFAEMVGKSLVRSGWKVEGVMSVEHLPPGVRILNKWEMTNPDGAFMGGPPYREAMRMVVDLERNLESEHPDISKEEAERLATLAVALGATLEKDPGMRPNELQIHIGAPRPIEAPKRK